MRATELIGSFFQALIAKGHTRRGIGGIAKYHVADSFVAEFEPARPARGLLG